MENREISTRNLRDADGGYSPLALEISNEIRQLLYDLFGKYVDRVQPDVLFVIASSELSAVHGCWLLNDVFGCQPTTQPKPAQPEPVEAISVADLKTGMKVRLYYSFRQCTLICEVVQIITTYWEFTDVCVSLLEDCTELDLKKGEEMWLSASYLRKIYPI